MAVSVVADVDKSCSVWHHVWCKPLKVFFFFLLDGVPFGRLLEWNCEKGHIVLHKSSCIAKLYATASAALSKHIAVFADSILVMDALSVFLLRPVSQLPNYTVLQSDHKQAFSSLLFRGNSFTKWQVVEQAPEITTVWKRHHSLPLVM